jgi:hypothetical protein
MIGSAWIGRIKVFPFHRGSVPRNLIEARRPFLKSREEQASFRLQQTKGPCHVTRLAHPTSSSHSLFFWPLLIYSQVDFVIIFFFFHYTFFPQILLVFFFHIPYSITPFPSCSRLLYVNI